jgi:hypothetical protein
MLILIPTDSNNIDEAEITLIDNVKYWALLDFNEGKVNKYTFFNTYQEIEEYMDVLIVKNTKEYVWSLEELGMAVLVAPFQNSVEDIMEAFIFKELHDFNNTYNKA